MWRERYVEGEVCVGRGMCRERHVKKMFTLHMEKQARSEQRSKEHTAQKSIAV